MKIKPVFFALASVTLVGCAPTGTYSYIVKGATTAQTALIRPANKEERQYKPSTAARIFLSPAGGAELTYFAPANDIEAGRNIHKYESLRVSPGPYVVRVLCPVGNFSVWFDLSIKALAGKVYLVECTGNRAAVARATIREVN